MQTNTEQHMVLPRLFIRQCRAARRRSKVVDSMKVEMTGGSLLMRSLIFRRLLLREVMAEDESHVGLLLPPSSAAVLANAALALSRRVAVNLNYTVSSEILNYCIEECGIRHVLTSRRVMDKLKLSVDCPLVYLEDLREKARVVDKLVGAFQSLLMSAPMLDRHLGLDEVSDDDVLTVIFTSGSTGRPKGVMLTHRNVGSNVEAIDQAVRLDEGDSLAAFLPFFHSFGYTTAMWTVLSLPLRGIFHFSPLEARQIGELCRQHDATIMFTTPTFLRSYLKRCDPEDFRALEVVVAGAEKLPAELSDAFEAKFGVRPYEGYGTTELSPLVSVNIPPGRGRTSGRIDLREGSIGLPVPGVTARIVHLDTGEELQAGQEGMLQVKGPNVMKGYLHLEELTDEVIRDGWYETGDIGHIDEDGFIFITGRQSRFSKIGGEMVPHVGIEQAIGQVIAGDEEELRAAVSAVPDERKGERLIVLYTELGKTPDQVCQAMSEAGLPNIWIPSPDSFYQVEEIPVLGTGKLDLKGLKDMALERCGSST